ncbi:MAG: hypothetical protein IIU99_03865, partial [Treponema sp.]|nr:hypothetical protein [Treponema sp.]
MTEKEQLEREKMETEKSLAKQTKELLDNGIPLTDIAKATKFSVEYFEHLLERFYPQNPVETNNLDIQTQLDFLKQQVHILQKKLDNTQSENIQLKQQVNTLQAKGVNMSEPIETTQGIQQWDYTTTYLTGGLEELKNLGDQGWEVVDGLKLDA